MRNAWRRFIGQVSLTAAGWRQRHQTKHVAEGREGVDGEESGGRDEERKEVSVVQLLVFLSSQTSGSRTCEGKTVFYFFFFFSFCMSCPVLARQTNESKLAFNSLECEESLQLCLCLNLSSRDRKYVTYHSDGKNKSVNHKLPF